MFTSPRWLALFLALVITFFSVAFLSFVPGIKLVALFVGGISTFFVSFFCTLFTIEILVFRQINKIYKTIKNLKLGGLKIGRGNLQNSRNPLKELNQEITQYVDFKQEEIEELR